MTTVRCDMSISLDGYICGPDAQEPPYVDAGFFRVTRWVQQLESWRDRQHLAGGVGGQDDDVVAEMFAQAGAYVMGRRMFDSGEVPWGEEPPFRAPVFVVTSRPREPLVRAGGTTFTFVTDGLASAIAQAREAAAGRHVAISGGAQVVQQAIAAGLLDELHLHVAPVLLGGGTRLLDGSLAGPVELERSRVIGSPDVTHLSFRFPPQ